jgi:hypothetical protein
MKKQIIRTHILTKMLAIGGLSAALLAPTVASAQTVVVGSSTPAKAAGCKTGRWSSTLAGRPAGFAKGAAQGAYLWHDKDGWHLRATHPGTELVTFSGVIDSSDGLHQVARALESQDEVRIQKARGRVSFEFTNRGGLDGIDFRVGCSNSFNVALRVNGQPIPNVQVFLGAQKVNPTSVPFRVERA